MWPVRRSGSVLARLAGSLSGTDLSFGFLRRFSFLLLQPSLELVIVDLDRVGVYLHYEACELEINRLLRDGDDFGAKVFNHVFVAAAVTALAFLVLLVIVQQGPDPVFPDVLDRFLDVLTRCSHRIDQFDLAPLQLGDGRGEDIHGVHEAVQPAEGVHTGAEHFVAGVFGYHESVSRQIGRVPARADGTQAAGPQGRHIASTIPHLLRMGPCG